MYFCYIDESGTSNIPGNTSHFVLAGLSIPVQYWKICDNEMEEIKDKYNLGGVELHVGWLLRPYIEQRNITNFEKLSVKQRRSRVQQLRIAELLRLQQTRNSKQYHQTKKNYRKTEPYCHLTYEERYKLIKEIAFCLSRWGFARLFAECIDKVYFDPHRRVNPQSIDEQCFEQIVSRFEHYLTNISFGELQSSAYGLLIHDNNETVAMKHTELMKRFHRKGTMWTQVKHIIETPLFVDSQLTSMIQIADLCAYAIRRYLENGEDELFNIIFQRADRKDGILVGIRHFTKRGCKCGICAEHIDSGRTPRLIR